MADLYGKLKGNRGEVTRMGSRSSGISAQLQTWTGALRVTMQSDGSYVVEEGHPKRSDWKPVHEGKVG